MEPNTTIADQNTERLIQGAYQPEPVPPFFAATLEAALLESAKSLPKDTTPPAPPPQKNWRWIALVVGTMAASILIGWAIIASMQNTPNPNPEKPGPFVDDGPKGNIQQVNKWTDDVREGLMPRRRAQATTLKVLKPGEKVATKAGERVLRQLSDGTWLYINEKTEVEATADRQLTLNKGQIYLEVAPKDDADKFVVKTGQREMVATGTHFAVQSDPVGAGVLVTQGKVAVKGMDREVTAGQRIEPGKTTITTAQRASHDLAWTRELMAAAETPMVPSCQHEGGALVAIDPNGQELKLALRKYEVDVHIEDGFARTTIDQTYFNTTWERLEGTFYFPLPPDASLSRLAMYVADGNGQCKLMEGGMAERKHAADVYETIRYQRRDPALLEWLDGTTFKMRVFPLEAKQEKRIILSYTQKLTSLYGTMRYRFPGGHSLPVVREWSFSARIKAGAGMDLWSPSHDDLALVTQSGDVLAGLHAKNAAPKADVWIEMKDREAGVNQDVPRFASFLHENHQYLMLRYRPNLPSMPERTRRDWIILFESSAGRDPVLAGTQVDIVRNLLKNAEYDDTFTLMSVNSKVLVFNPGEPNDVRRPARPAEVEKAIAFLHKSHLVGALDLQQGIEAAVKLAKQAKNPHIVHIGSGTPAMGERDAGTLAKMLPENVPYVGVGVGKRWNRAFMKAAAERTNGLFTQINPDETIAWRAFDLLATLNTPRLLGVQVLDANGKAKFLTETSMIAQGEEICALTRVDMNQTAIPGKVIVKGTLNGKAVSREFVVINVLPGAGYLPRTWAKLEIDRMLAENAAKHKTEITNLSKAMYVMSPFTSLLVLETDADYERFKVDKGRKDHWAMYQVPPRIPLVYEPDGKQPQKEDKKDAKKHKKPSIEEVLKTIAMNTPAPRGGEGKEGFMIVDIDPAAEFDSDIAYYFPSRGANVSVPGKISADDTIGIIDSLKDGDTFNLPAPGGLGANGTRSFFGRTGGSKAGGLKGARAGFGFGAQKEKDKAKQAPAERREEPRAGLRALSDELERLAGGTKRIDAAEPLQLESLRLGERDLGLKLRGMNKEVEDGKARLHFAPPYVAPQMEWAIPKPALKDAKAPKMPEPSTGPLLGLELSFQSPQVHRFSLPLSDKNEAKVISPRSMRYERPAFAYDRSYFVDLVQYAPGLHHHYADILATLDTEAEVGEAKLGAIDAVARTLIDQARSGDWLALTIPANGPLPSYKVYYNGQGQFAYERTLISGLREEVICDGKTLWHLYPEIGLAAKRPFSRYHQPALASFNPGFLPAAEELARGYDVKAIDPSTVALVPFGVADLKAEDKYHRVHLVFANGRLAERRIVEMPLGKVLLRQIFAADGSVEWKDAEDKVVASQKFTVARTAAPRLTPNTSDLVVMQMPIRTRGYWLDKWNKEEKREHIEQVIVSECMTRSSGSSSVMIHFGTHFHQKGDRRLGFYTLINACGYPIVNENLPPIEKREWKIDIEQDHPNNPLATFLAQAQRELTKNDQSLIKKLPGPSTGFVHHMTQFRNLWLTWQNQRPLMNGGAEQPLEKAKVLEFLKTTTSPTFAYALLDTMQRRCNTAPTDHMMQLVSDRLGPISDPLGLGYIFRYEHARTLWQAGKAQEAAKLYKELHSDTLGHGVIPPIDGAFRDTLQIPVGEGPRFIAYTRKSLEDLLGKKRYGNAFQLAKQMEQLGDEAMSDEILSTILSKATAEDRAALTLICVNFLSQRKNFVQADRLLVKVLAEKKVRTAEDKKKRPNEKEWAEYPELWRWRAELNKQAGQVATSIECLEKALDLEYADLPEIVNLDSIREDYRTLLTHYQKISEASASLEKSATKVFLAKVIRTADRWRLVDSDASEPSMLAGRILYTMGERDLAWDYWTTPIDLHPAESQPWLQLAETMKSHGDLERADRALAIAFEAEPTNPELLWKRAQNAVRMGQPDRARELYRQIASSDWQERFQATVEQARGLAGQ